MAGTGLALHQETIPAAVAVGGQKHSAGRSWDRYLAFSSTRDLTGSGAAGRQIYVYNHFNWVCQRGRPNAATLASCPNPPEPFVVQITTGPGSPDNPTVTDLFNTNQPPPASPVQQWVAFDADGSYNGSTGCEASRRQIFLYEIYSNELRQVTFACDGDSTNPTLAFHGGLLAFESTGSIIGPPSPVGVKQIYTYFRGNNVLRKVTAAAADSHSPMINKIGTRVIFQSSADHLGDLSDTGIQQIFWSDYDRGKHKHTIHQLTKGNADSIQPYAAEERPFVAFASQATDLPGSFSPGGQQIYLARLDTEPVADLPPVTQLTFQAQYGSCSWPAASPGEGSRIGFICNQDPSPFGGPGNRVYAIELENGQTFSVSAATDVAGPIHMNMGPWFVTMATSFDLVGDGQSCGSQLWVVDYHAGPQGGNGKIGVRHFTPELGDAVGGSEGQLVTKTGTLTGDVTDAGSLDLRFGAPDPATGETLVEIPLGYANLPPIPFPGLGAVCIEQTGVGGGILDCDGGKFGVNASVRQDHFTDDTDPSCITPGACREDDPTCHSSVLPGPHRVECPRCTNVPNLGPRCNSGLYMGLVCAVDSDCRIGMPECSDATIDNAMCNGPMISELTGNYGAGGTLLNLPVGLKFSLEVGADNTFCTADDLYDPYFGARTEQPLLRLTTGTAQGLVVDANAVQGTNLGTGGVGGAIDCTRLRQGDLTGAKLVGTLPLLDLRLPDRPQITDAVFALHLAAKPSSLDVCGVPCATDNECNDLDACNGVETCSGGFCTAGTAVVCDDGDACNGVETCSPSTGSCLSAMPPLCDDGNPCNGAETCDASLGCLAGTAVECNDFNPCNGVETCNQLTGTCSAGIPLCDDLNPCNGTEICDPISSTCAPGTPITCDDLNPCNGVEACNTQTGACEASTPPLCDDLNPCNGIEICNPSTSQCTPGSAPNCDDGNPCTLDSCDTVTGCKYAPKCDDGNACNGVESCDIATGICSPGAATNCDDGDPCTLDSCHVDRGCEHGPTCGDGNLCNGIETCDPVSGACGPGGPLNCDDGNACTDDSCDPVEGCVHQNNLDTCDDGDPCTLSDTCSLGECGGTPKLCSNNDACDGFELCDPTTGDCLDGTPLECDDSNVCTDDSCNPLIGCVTVNNGASCDDASICTTNDHCVAGQCTGESTCDDGDVCNGDEVCDPGSGACSPGTNIVCDDGNTCTDDSCDPTAGCRTVNNSGSCDDASACTVGDQCVNGACLGAAAPCDNADACDGVEICDPSSGSCTPGTAPNCDDGLTCTTDSCDPVLGCRNEPLGSGAEAVLCLLQAIESQLNNPPALAFRSEKLRGKLLRLITGAERKVLKVLGGVRRPRPLLGKVKKALDLFDKRLRNGQARLRIERNFAGQLMEIASPAGNILAPLIKPSTALAQANVEVSVSEAAAAAEELAGTIEGRPSCNDE